MTRSRDTADTQDNIGGAVAPFVAGKNKIINGDFGVWQRGTSFSAGGYSSDRWTYDSDATVTVSRQTFAPGTAPVAGYEGQFFYRIAKSAGGSYISSRQRIEDVRTFAGQTVTVSYWAKADAAVTIAPYYIQNFGSGGSADVGAAIASQAITTSWVRYTHTLAIPSIAGKTIGTSSYLEIYVGRYVGAAATTIDIWGVQVEAGSVATPFTTASGSIGGELALCQRYYAVYRTYVLPGSPFGQTALRPAMRVTPTVVGGGGAGFTLLDNSNTFVLSLQTTAAVQGLTFDSEL